MAGDYDITIHDALGRLVLAKNTEGSAQINTSNWQNGIYFVKVTDKNSKAVQNTKVIIQH